MAKKLVVKRYVSHAKAFKNPKGYVDPYVVRVWNGQQYVFHSWHGSKASAQAEVKRLGRRYGRHIVYK